MSSLFADTHSVVSILEKSDAAEGFEQIIDFLSGSYIHYALTVNPHIYISYIKQFWNTASVKRSADVTRLQALVDKKKIVISEMGYEKPSTKLTFYKAFFSSQWKFLIHTILQSLSTKRTSWNEFSTAMASVVICLSKGVETPLFEGMLAVRQPTEEGLAEAQVQADDAVVAAVEENVAEDGADFPTHIQQVLDVCSALTRRVANLEYDNAAQKLEIIKLQARVKSVASATISAAKPSIPAAALIVVAAYTRRRKEVIIRDPKEELSSKTPAETPKLKDKGRGILIETPKPMKKKDKIKLDAEYAKKLHEEINKDHEEFNKDIDWDAAMDHVNQK
nr:hypothetical protein [Tanacetum cinerariifolium]